MPFQVRRRIKVAVTCVALAAAGALAAGCTSAPMSPSRQPAVQQHTFTGTIPVGSILASNDLTVARDGTLVARLTWSNPQVDLSLQLTEPNCGVFCPVLAASASNRGTVEEISRAVRTGEQYRLEVINETRFREASYVLDVVVR